MKRWLLLLATVALTACGGATSGTDPTPVPAKVTSLIHELKTQSPPNSPDYIARYDYQGGMVYYVPPRCCDIFSDLYDASGQLICHPDGGLAGHGDGRCPDFLSRRTNELILWRRYQ